MALACSYLCAPPAPRTQAAQSSAGADGLGRHFKVTARARTDWKALVQCVRGSSGRNASAAELRAGPREAVQRPSGWTLPFTGTQRDILDSQTVSLKRNRDMVYLAVPASGWGAEARAVARATESLYVGK